MLDQELFILFCLQITKSIHSFEDQIEHPLNTYTYTSCNETIHECILYYEIYNIYLFEYIIFLSENEIEHTNRRV